MNRNAMQAMNLHDTLPRTRYRDLEPGDVIAHPTVGDNRLVGFTTFSAAALRLIRGDAVKVLKVTDGPHGYVVLDTDGGKFSIPESVANTRTLVIDEQKLQAVRAADR